MNIGSGFGQKTVRGWSASVALIAAACIGYCSSAVAQQSPQTGYVYPAGGKRGSTFHVKVGGQFLRGATNAFLSGGIGTAEFVEFNRPMSQNEFNELRDRLRELLEKKRTARNGGSNVWTIAEQDRVDEIRNRILRNPPNRQGNPAIAESVILRIALSPEAEPGEHELRLSSSSGLSNPLVFMVGILDETTRPAAKAPITDSTLVRLLNIVETPASNAALRITPPVVVNGQVMPGAIDRFRFSGRQGERIVVNVSARRLIPYLADAVPGWFQATVAIRDSSGRELAHQDDYRFHPDPVLLFEVPRDDDYILEIQDAIYRGRDDFVYRITIGDLPFVTALFPIGGRSFSFSEVELTGWNLPRSRIRVHNNGPGITSIPASHETFPRAPFAVDDLAETFDIEQADSGALPVQLPVVVNGRIDSSGDTDVFRFRGQAGAAIVAEVLARRLDSPLDSVLTLTDPRGKVIATSDDCDQGDGIHTHHADSMLQAKLASDGTYQLRIHDAQRHGGIEFGYRLRIGPPRPDFALRVVPSGITVRGGANVPITVHVLRRDGFNGDIRLVLTNAPPGFGLCGARVPAGQERIQITLNAPASPTRDPVSIGINGEAMIEGRRVVRSATPCDDRMQAFAYRHLVPAKELKVAVIQRGTPVGRMKPIGDGALKFSTNGVAKVRFGPAPANFMETFEIVLNAPEGIGVKHTAIVDGAVEVGLAVDRSKMKSGAKGNLIFSLTPIDGSQRDKQRPSGVRRGAVGCLPAVEFEVF